MLFSPTFQALSVNGRRALDFLQIEHANHGGKENGNLPAPYRQLEEFGLTGADVRKAICECDLLGFLIRTFVGMRQAGGGEPARYALTWRKTRGEFGFVEATNDWERVRGELAAQGLTSARQVRAWLKDRLKEEGIGRASNRFGRLSPAPDIDSARQMSPEPKVRKRA